MARFPTLLDPYRQRLLTPFNSLVKSQISFDQALHFDWRASGSPVTSRGSPPKNPEHARKNCKVLRGVRREEEFFPIPTVFALQGSIKKKIVLRWNDTPFVPVWDQIKRE